MAVIGDYLKSVRMQRGISLKEVYRRTGISDSKLSRIENGSKSFEMAPYVLKELAELYEIDLIDLLINAGYLDAKELSSYKRVFQNVDLLNEEEKRNIQEQIDLFTKERKHT